MGHIRYRCTVSMSWRVTLGSWCICTCDIDCSMLYTSTEIVLAYCVTCVGSLRSDCKTTLQRIFAGSFYGRIQNALTFVAKPNFNLKAVDVLDAHHRKKSSIKAANPKTSIKAANAIGCRDTREHLAPEITIQARRTHTCRTGSFVMRASR